ncbi:MAG: hypothetical protein ACRDMY_09310 [Gaiellaceae bacterium]
MLARGGIKEQRVEADETAMALDIRDVLNRRSDLSTFLVHLTREQTDGMSAASNLESIICERRLRAASPLGWAKTQDDADDPTRQTQRVVCFSETPLEHTYSLFADIAGRDVQLQPYGLALTKILARMMGVHPVWYVDMTTRGGREWEEARALDELRDQAVEAETFHTSPLAKILPFFEHMGTWPNSRKEFWWEREWRHRGELDLTPYWNRMIWLCPEDEHATFESLVADAAPPGQQHGSVCLDPGWGTEQIIARLCGLPAEDVSLFYAAAGRNNNGS